MKLDKGIEKVGERATDKGRGVEDIGDKKEASESVANY